MCMIWLFITRMKLVLTLLCLVLSIGDTSAVYFYLNSSTHTALPLQTPTDYFQFLETPESQRLVWPENANDNDFTDCSDTIDAQYNAATNTYSLQYWYYYTSVFGSLSVSTALSITDLQAFAAYAFSVGVWDGNPPCQVVCSRIYGSIVRPIYANNPFIFAPGPLITESNGLAISFECNGVVCTSNQLADILQLSGDNIDRVRLLYSSKKVVT